MNCFPRYHLRQLPTLSPSRNSASSVSRDSATSECPLRQARCSAVRPSCSQGRMRGGRRMVCSWLAGDQSKALHDSILGCEEYSQSPCSAPAASSQLAYTPHSSWSRKADMSNASPQKYCFCNYCIFYSNIRHYQYCASLCGHDCARKPGQGWAPPLVY
jgi:hypothetical protein